MNTEGSKFEIGVHARGYDSKKLYIHYKLNEKLSEEAIKRLELEAVGTITEILQPLKTTIRNIEAKYLNKPSNLDDDVCEACQ